MAIKKTVAGTYCVDFRDQAGRRLRKTFDTLKAAREYDRISKGDISKDEFTSPSSITVLDVANEWHKRKVETKGYRPATLGNWRTYIDKYVAPMLGALKVQQIRIKYCENAAGEWSKMCSANTANCVLTTLAAIFQLAQRRELVRQNPAELAERIKINRDEENHDAVLPGDVYGEAELKQLIGATDAGTHQRCLVMVPALCGLRIGEVLGSPVQPSSNVGAS
jgi:integrase